MTLDYHFEMFDADERQIRRIRTEGAAMRSLDDCSGLGLYILHFGILDDGAVDFTAFMPGTRWQFSFLFP